LERHVHAGTDASPESERHRKVAVDFAIPVSCGLVRAEETRRVERLWVFEQVWVLDKHAVELRKKVGLGREEKKHGKK
jgi:hypothetical protein